MGKGVDAYLINNRVTSVTLYCPSFAVNCKEERKAGYPAVNHTKNITINVFKSVHK